MASQRVAGKTRLAARLTGVRRVLADWRTRDAGCETQRDGRTDRPSYVAARTATGAPGALVASAGSRAHRGWVSHSAPVAIAGPGAVCLQRANAAAQRGGAAVRCVRGAVV